ncbi:MAG TPA: hypothetical protein VF443_11300 [Nitrospira sp.]
MLNRPTICLVSLSLLLAVRETAHAESAQDRVALMLSGPGCPSVREGVTTALQQQAGVLRADPDLMPDHVLVDIVRPQMTEETVAAIANAATGGGRCRAEIMRSCITAELPNHGTDPPQSASSQAHSH